MKNGGDKNYSPDEQKVIRLLESILHELQKMNAGDSGEDIVQGPKKCLHLNTIADFQNFNSTCKDCGATLNYL